MDEIEGCLRQLISQNVMALDGQVRLHEWFEKAGVNIRGQDVSLGTHLGAQPLANRPTSGPDLEAVPPLDRPKRLKTPKRCLVKRTFKQR
jgi:hypothetical protein